MKKFSSFHSSDELDVIHGIRRRKRRSGRENLRPAQEPKKTQTNKTKLWRELRKNRSASAIELTKTKREDNCMIHFYTTWTYIY